MTIQDARRFFNKWMCGCGSPEACVRLVYDALRLHPLYEHRDDVASVLPTTGIEMFVLYLLDHWDLTEHGGSVGGGWLTDQGKALLAVLDSDAANGFETVCAQACMHGYACDTDELRNCPECGPLNEKCEAGAAGDK